MSKTTTPRANARTLSKTPPPKPDNGDWLNRIMRFKQDALATLTLEETRRLAALPDQAFEREMSAAEPQPLLELHEDFESSQLVALAAGLKACDERKVSACAADNNVQNIIEYELHWAAREKIESISATTLAGLRAKAFAAELALKEDPEVECGDIPGSFVALTRSINRDIMAMADGAAAKGEEEAAA